jgi:hypothetical protein
MHGLIDVTPQVEISGALEELGYHGTNVTRWATSAKIARSYGQRYDGDAYLRLLVEELEKIEEQAERLRRALSAASVQYVSHETKEIAA